MHISLSENKKEWNDFILKNSSDEFLQSWEWGDFQKSYGRKVWRILIREHGKTIAQAMTMCMSLPAGKSYVYVPRGPVWTRGRGRESADVLWSLLVQNWRLIGLESHAFFVSVEPGFRRHIGNDTEKDTIQDFIKDHEWKKTKQVQPEYVAVVPLTQSLESMLKKMHPKTRYNIRLSEKKHLTIEQKNDKDGLAIFWTMLQETAQRDYITMYPYSYYRKIYTILYERTERDSKKIPVARIWIVRQRSGIPIASALTILFGKSVYYLYGASTTKKRELMGSHFMQWKIIQWCKDRGFEHYDLGGVAPPDAPEDHSWAGITRFKNGFGAETMQYPGTFTYPYNRMWYRMYILGKWAKRIMK